MSRFVPVTSINSLSDEYRGERWVNLDLIEDLLPLVKGGTRLVYASNSYLDIKETPEQLIKLQGA